MSDSEVVIVIPVLNEADNIQALLTDLLADGTDFPIWVWDGCSTDRTREIVAGIACTNPRLQLFHNHGRTQARAVNLAARRARQAGAKLLVRMDAHAAYPAGYVSGLITTIRKSGAQSVVVPLHSTGNTAWTNAVADLQNSWLGNGGAAHRTGKRRGWVRHGHHAVFQLEWFLKIGGYDAHFSANEDAEFDKRLTRAGGRIFLENQYPVTYAPRATPTSLWRQMYRNGRFRVETAHKHGETLDQRQQIPVLVTLASICSALLGALISPIVALPLGLYLTFVLFYSALSCWHSGPLHCLRMAFAAAVIHFGFGCGVLRGCFFAPALRRNPTRNPGHAT